MRSNQKTSLSELASTVEAVPPNTPNVSTILQQRGTLYGSFRGHADLTQLLKTDFYAHMEHSNKRVLNNVQAEAIDMIFHKLGRIGNGDPNYLDSWQDIAGYAQLVVNDLKEK